MSNFTRNDIKPCAICGKGLMHPGNPLGLFFRLTAQRKIIDRQAVQQEAGLEMMMGGNVAIARALSPVASLAKVFGQPVSFLVCEPCALEKCGDLPAALWAEDEVPA